MQPTSAPLRIGDPGMSRAAVLIALGFVCLFSTGCWRPSSPVQTLRDSLHQASGEEWTSEIELGVGPLTLGLARAGGMVFELPPEVRTVLRAVRGADVGVYRLRHADRVMSDARVLPAADRALDREGWDRVVKVREGAGKTVVVYVSREPEWSRRMGLCLVVWDGPQMVLVSARGNPAPLVELALAQARGEAASRNGSP